METLKEEDHFRNFDTPLNNNQQQPQQNEQQDTNNSNNKELNKIPSNNNNTNNSNNSSNNNSPNYPLSISISSSLGSPSSMQLTPQGTIGNYLVIKTIGRGQFGKVKLGYHKKIPNEKVAIKIINKGKLDPETLKMVQREVRIMKLLHHPNIIRLYEVIETSRALYLIMEYAGEGEVMDFMIAHGVLTELQARTFFTQIVSAINYCHSKKAVHRDLKPENLLLDSNRQIKIIDFGLSNVFTPGSYLKTFCGSPTYASPELILRKEYNGPSVDVWSMGVVLFVLVTGYLPFDGDNYVELFQKILAGDYTIPNYLSQDCKSLISRMLVVDPDKRATMDEIINHPWLSSTKQNIISSIHSIAMTTTTSPSPSSIQEEELDLNIIEELVNLGFEREELCNSIRQNKYNDAASTYFLLQGKKMRESLENQTEQAKKLEKFYAESLKIPAPIGENSPLIKYKRHHKRSHTVDSPKSTNTPSISRNSHNHPQHQQHQQTTSTTTTTTATNNTTCTTSTSSTSSSVNPSPLFLSNAVPVGLRDKLREKELNSGTNSNNSSNQSINSTSPSASTSPNIQPLYLASNNNNNNNNNSSNNQVQRRATSSALQHQQQNNNNSNNTTSIRSRLRSNSSSVADQTQRQQSRKLEDDWVIFEDYSNDGHREQLSKNHNHSLQSSNIHKKQKSPVHSFLSSFKNILKRSDEKSFSNHNSSSSSSTSSSVTNTPRSNQDHSSSSSSNNNNNDQTNSTTVATTSGSPNVTSSSTNTTQEPRIVRFVFGVNTTTMKDAPELMQQVLKVIDQFCIPNTKKAPFLIECETEGVRFSIEICRLPRLSVNGLKFKRIGGSSWRYKSICKDLLSQMKLNSQ